MDPLGNNMWKDTGQAGWQDNVALAVDYDDEPIIVSVTMGTGQSQPAVMVKLEDKPDEICVPCLYGLVSLSVSSDIYIYIS